MGKIVPSLLRSSRCTPTASAAFSTSTRLPIAQPNPRLNFDDPSLEALLQDVDITMHARSRREKTPMHELEILSSRNVEAEALHEDYDQVTHGNLPRKSPAALFGSQLMGSVVLPLQMQGQIQHLISGG